MRRIFRYVRETEGSFAAFLLTSNPEEGGPAQSANREQMLAAIEATLRALESRRGSPGRRAAGSRGAAARRLQVAAELQFGLVESALRDCFLRRGGADEEIYIREVTRCLTAYLELTPGS